MSKTPDPSKPATLHDEPWTAPPVLKPSGPHSFTNVAKISQAMKATAYNYIFNSKNNVTIAPDQQEALDLIFHEIGGIVADNPDDPERWRKVSAYALMIADRIRPL